jgi:hypothetical protein
MNKQHDIEILEAMNKYGGSFARSISLAAWAADSENYAKLKAAFPELWTQYAVFAKKVN